MAAASLARWCSVRRALSFWDISGRLSSVARRGDSYPSILSHYYRGTQLRSYGELAFTAAAEPGSGSRVLSDGHAQVVATGPVQQP